MGITTQSSVPTLSLTRHLNSNNFRDRLLLYIASESFLSRLGVLFCPRFMLRRWFRQPRIYYDRKSIGEGLQEAWTWSKFKRDFDSMYLVYGPEMLWKPPLPKPDEEPATPVGPPDTEQRPDGTVPVVSDE